MNVRHVTCEFLSMHSLSLSTDKARPRLQATEPGQSIHGVTYNPLMHWTKTKRGPTKDQRERSIIGSHIGETRDENNAHLNQQVAAPAASILACRSIQDWDEAALSDKGTEQHQNVSVR